VTPGGPERQSSSSTSIGVAANTLDLRLNGEINILADIGHVARNNVAVDRPGQRAGRLYARCSTDESAGDRWVAKLTDRAIGTGLVQVAVPLLDLDRSFH
jgi:hypothetical protein